MVFEKLSHFFGTSDLEDWDEDEVESATTSTPTKSTVPTVKTDNSRKVVSISQAGSALNSSQILVTEPRLYADAKDIATNLLNNRAVIVNFNRLDQAQACRIVDFLTGTVYAIKGQIQRIGDNIFLCTPAQFEVEGTLQELKNKKSQDFGY